MSTYSEKETGYQDTNEDELFEISECFGLPDSQPKEGDYILVQFDIGSWKVFYLTKGIREVTRCVEISYLKNSPKIKKAFYSYNVPDVATVLTEDIKMILQKPAFSRGNKRQQGVYKFDFIFSGIYLR